MNYKLIGLTDYEEQAYKALVKHGKCSAAQASKASGVSYGKIYTVLENLERKGLVMVIPEESKKFIATEPENLIKLAEEKEKELAKLKKEATVLQQEYQHQAKEPVEIVKGKRNFHKLMNRLPSATEYSYIVKYTSEFRPEWLRYDKNLRDKGIVQKRITRVAPENIKDLQKWKKGLGKHFDEFKIMDNDGAAIAFSDKQVTIVLINQNTTIAIYDRALSDVLKKLVDAYHAQAQPVNEVLAQLSRKEN